MIYEFELSEKDCALFSSVFVNGEESKDWFADGNKIVFNSPPKSEKMRGLRAFFYRVVGVITKNKNIYSRGMEYRIVIVYEYNGALKIDMFDGRVIKKAL